MANVPLFGVGLQGKSPNVTAQVRVNCYYEFQADGDRTRIAIYGTPGLELFVDFGDTPARGMHAPQWNDYLYVVHRGTFWQVDNAGTTTNRGTLLTTSGKVSIADNGTQVMVVDGTYGYIYNASTLAFTQIADADFPSSPQTVTFQDGYFIVNKGSTGQFYISASYNGTAWDATDLATAESNPDALIRVIADHGELILFGDVSTEFWANTGATDFPYARIAGSATEWGLAAKWSLAKYDNSMAFLAKNRMGEVIVARMNGYQPERISNFELESLINGYATVSDAVGFSYMLGGHPMYQISFPSAGYSWLYDGSTGVWSRLKSHNLTRHRAELHANYLNTNVVSDYTNGRLYRLKSSIYTDNGDPITLELVSKHVFKNDKMLSVPKLQIDMESGVGLATGQGSDPQAMLQVSKDGGHTWGAELWTDIGQIGEYAKRVLWRRLGRAYNWTFKLKISDPVKRVIIGANIEVVEGV